MNIVVRVLEKGSKAKVEFSDKTYNAVIGKAGAIDEQDKVEGDQKTPVGGPYKVLKIYYREDRIPKPQTRIPTIALEDDDIWIDDPKDIKYNQPAKIGDSKDYLSHETLYRDDHLYDLLVDIGFNRENSIPGKGSAIFLHLSRDQIKPANTPTAGCIGLRKNDLLGIIQKLDKNSSVYIKKS